MISLTVVAFIGLFIVTVVVDWELGKLRKELQTHRSLIDSLNRRLSNIELARLREEMGGRRP